MNRRIPFPAAATLPAVTLALLTWAGPVAGSAHSDESSVGLGREDRESAVAVLEQSAAAFLSIASSLGDAELAFRPHEAAWSIGDIAEHLAKVERVVQSILADQVMASPERPELVGPQGPPVNDRAIRLALTNRDERFHAPDSLVPERELSGGDALAQFEAARAETLDYCRTTEHPLRLHFALHPLLGQIDGVQWLLFAAAHVERHTEQAVEVMAHPRFPRESVIPSDAAQVGSATSAGSRGGGSDLEPLPLDLEVELALSALPEHLRAEATVHLLEPASGFRVHRRGSNGFHALVARTDHGAFLGSWPYTSYPEDFLIPISFDAEGARTHMKVYLDVAELQAVGMPPAELKKLIRERFANGYYRAPDRSGVAYMLAPIVRAYQRPEDADTVVTFSLPHYMYYAPWVTNADIGGGASVFEPFIQYQTPTPHGLIIHVTGAEERRRIREERADMLEQLCHIRDTWCLESVR